MDNINFFESSIILNSQDEVNFWKDSYKQIQELLCNIYDTDPWDKDRVLSEIFKRFNVSFSLSIFDEGFLHDNFYPNAGYEFAYEQHFGGINRNEFPSVTLYSESEQNPRILGLVVQGFFRKFRKDGFFGLEFFGGYMIVTSERVEVFKNEDLIAQQRSIHERGIR